MQNRILHFSYFSLFSFKIFSNWQTLSSYFQLFLAPWLFCVSWLPWGITVWQSGWQTTKKTFLSLRFWTTLLTGLSGSASAALGLTLPCVEWLPWVALSCPNQKWKSRKNPLCLQWTCSTKEKISHQSLFLDKINAQRWLEIVTHSVPMTFLVSCVVVCLRAGNSIKILKEKI